MSFIQCPLSVQDKLEEVLDVVLANQRYVLSERHAQRKFLVHSLHSLNSLISDIFSSTSSNLDSCFTHIRRLVLSVVIISYKLLLLHYKITRLMKMKVNIFPSQHILSADFFVT